MIDKLASSSVAQPATPRPDPFDAVNRLGDRAMRIGWILGLTVGIVSHGSVASSAISGYFMRDLCAWATVARDRVHAYVWTTYDVDVVKQEEKHDKPPDEDKQPDKDDAPVAAPAPRAAPAEPAPAAAQAGNVMTAPSDPNEPVNFTDNTFVTGNGDMYVGGVTAPAGTGTVAVYDPHAVAGGTPGGKGTALAEPVKHADRPDQSHAPGVVAGSNWSSCPFPPEADVEQVDYAVVTIAVSVRPDGTPKSVKIVNDPGHGFGRAARMCALGQQYTPGTDHDGNPIEGTTPPIRVTFTR